MTSPSDHSLASDQGFVCVDCRNVFLQPPRCTTCGAEKLYDATTRQQAETIVAQERRIAELESQVATLNRSNNRLRAKLDKVTNR